MSSADLTPASVLVELAARPVPAARGLLAMQPPQQAGARRLPERVLALSWRHGRHGLAALHDGHHLAAGCWPLAIRSTPLPMRPLHLLRPRRLLAAIPTHPSPVTSSANVPGSSTATTPVAATPMPPQMLRMEP